MSLFTVRLSPADDKLVKALRADGVQVADLVRTALRTEHERRRRQPLTPRDVRDLVAEIYARHPIPADTAPVPVNTLDRKAVREFIASKVKRSRRK